MNGKKALSQSVLSKIWMVIIAIAALDYIRHDDTLVFNVISFTLAFIASVWFGVNFKNGRRVWAFVAAGFILYFDVHYALLLVGWISQETLSLRLRPATNGFAWLPVWYLYVFQPIENKLSEAVELHKARDSRKTRRGE